MSATTPPPAPMLIPLARAVIEAALEAELREHLAGQTSREGLQPTRRNARNGSRPKTVRTAVGLVTIDVPRDRWGTYEPVTVGKWQREAVPIDRLLLLLAAHGVPSSDLVSLLTTAYPRQTPTHTLTRIGATVQAHLRPWHDRLLTGCYPVLNVHLHAPRGLSGVRQLPVVSVVGTAAPDARGQQRRELLSLRALASPHSRQAWLDVVSDLHRRQLTGVQWVAGPAAAPFREAAAQWWPLEGSATTTTALTALTALSA